MGQINRRLFLFTDEFRLCRDFTDKRETVWRIPWDRFHTATVAQHERYGGGSVIALGSINWDRRTELIVLNSDRMTCQRYIDEIVDCLVRLYGRAVGDKFI